MLYTIGSSNRTADEFYGELKKRGITKLIDVRSGPFYSRNADFKFPESQVIAASYGVQYVWQGKLLGGKNDIPTTHDDFRRKADALIEMACEQDIAIFCVEGDPKDCHRSFKIGGYALVQYGLIASNILRNGEEEDVTKTLTKTNPDWMPPCIRAEMMEIAYKSEQKTVPIVPGTAQADLFKA